MNKDAAKFLLNAYRPSGRDANDPAFAEALAATENDTELKAWLTNGQAFDAAVSAKLQSVEPPVDLRAAILAGGRASMAKPAPQGRGVWLAAASFAVLFTALAVFGPRWARPTFTLDTFASSALADVSGLHQGARDADEVGEIGTWLQDPKNRLLAGLPASEADFQKDRCRTVRLAGRDVFEICFRRDVWYHVYIAPRRGMPMRGEELAPMFREQGRLASVTWGDSRNVYVMVTDAGPDALRGVL